MRRGRPRVIHSPRKDSGAEKLVDGTEHAVRHHAIRNILPEDAYLLPSSNDFPHELDVPDEMMMGELSDKASALAHLCLHNDSHTAIHGVALQMNASDVFQLFSRISPCPELFFHLMMEAVED